MTPSHLPIAAALFAQWRRARGDRAAPAARPFSRAWEQLLEDAALLSATEREDAHRDARALAQNGWVELRPERYRPHLVDRILIPLAAEPRWREAFGCPQPSDDDAPRLRAFAWEPELAFLREARTGLPFDDLRRLNAFLAGGGRQRPKVPVKERSLELFGDEKRLDGLLGSSLFGDGRLSLDLLGILPAPEPLPWKRGPAAAADQPVIILENAATWHSYDRWNQARPRFSAVIYGGGNRFLDGVGFLAEIFRELGGTRPVFYFGDLDPHGLRIPQIASGRAVALGLPEVRPHLWSYRQLLLRGALQPQPGGDAADAQALDSLAAWLGELAGPALDLLRSGHRLAQEHVGWEHLQASLSAPADSQPEGRA